MVVLEGCVDKFYVIGLCYFDQGCICVVVIEFVEGKVFNFNVVQQQVVVLLQMVDCCVQLVLCLGCEFGIVEVEFKVSDQFLLGGSVEVNNVVVVGIEVLCVVVNLYYDNFFQCEYLLLLIVLIVFMDMCQLCVLVLNYFVLLDDGVLLSFGVVNFCSDIDSLGGMCVLGKGMMLIWCYGFNCIDEYVVYGLLLGFDVKDLKEDVQMFVGVISMLLCYVLLQLVYNGSWWGEVGVSQQWSVSVIFGFKLVW